MRNIVNYYAAIILPLVCLLLINANGLLNSKQFAISILIYAFIYHPFVSGSRLLSMGIIKKSELAYSFIPGWILKHFAALFFNRQ